MNIVVYIQMGFVYQLIIFIIQMGKWIPSSGQWPSVVPVGMWRWFPGHLCSHLLCTYFMPHAGLDAGVTVMNKVSSLPAGKLQKCRQTKSMSEVPPPLCVQRILETAVLSFTPAPSPSPASLPFALMRVAGAAVPPPLLVQAGGGRGEPLTGSGVSVTALSWIEPTSCFLELLGLF